MLTNRVGIAAFLISFSIANLYQSPAIEAQTRDEKVLRDRESVTSDGTWYYDDIEKGFEAAAESNKPLMVVIRCIP